MIILKGNVLLTGEFIMLVIVTGEKPTKVERNKREIDIGTCEIQD
jgi:hypothetical protein